MVKMISQKVTYKMAIATLAASVAIAMPNSALAARLSLDEIDQIYVFGDSLSDTGNAFQATGNQIPPSPPYFQGRFSNGPVWVEYLAQTLGLPATSQFNFAFGGATTGTDNTINPALPGLSTEIAGYLATNPPVNPNGLYVVWAGANDYLGGGITNPSTPVSNLTSAITSLTEFGAKNILIVNLPDLGQLPSGNNTPLETPLDTLSSAHNFGLATALNQLQTTLGSDINLIPFDINSVFRQVLNNPQKFGFTNVIDACLTQVSICSNPDEYLFWDGLHVTTAGHEIIADSAFQSLQSAAVPEPTFIVGTLSFAAYLAYLKKRRTPAKIQATANT